MSKYTTKNEWMYWETGAFMQSMKFKAECDAVEVARMLNEQNEEIDVLRAENEKMLAVVDAATTYYESPYMDSTAYELLMMVVEKYKPKTREQLLDERLAAADALHEVFKTIGGYQGKREAELDALAGYHSAKQAHEEAESS